MDEDIELLYDEIYDEYVEEETEKKSVKIEKKDVGVQQDDGQLRRHAIQLRHLVITARNQIDELREELKEAKLRLETAGTVQCPDCTKVFKERDSIVHPKYIRLVKSTLTLEVSFEDLNQLNEWLIVNGLDQDKMGNQTYVPSKEQKDSQQITLTESSSQILHFQKLLQEKEREMRAEFERKMTEKVAEIRNEMRAKSEKKRTNLECGDGKENRGRNRNEFRKRRCSRSPQDTKSGYSSRKRSRSREYRSNYRGRDNNNRENATSTLSRDNSYRRNEYSKRADNDRR